MKRFNVTGMSCAACSARVEKAVKKVSGVKSCSVSLLTNSMLVEGTAGASEIIEAVVNAGYGAEADGASETGTENSEFYSESSCCQNSAGNDCHNSTAGNNSYSKKNKKFEQLEDAETPKLLKRFFWSLGFVLILMYFSMGHTMWSWPVPEFFNGNTVSLALLQMVLAGIVLVINQKFFINGFKGLLHGAPNMDTLVSLGSGVSFCWSTFILFLMISALNDGKISDVEKLYGKLYFESSAMILVFITLGKTLESYSKGKTTNALKSLMKLAPETAVILRDGKEVEIPAASVRTGDIFVIRPGDAIPVDGTIIEGSSAVDESAITGESVPVDKTAGAEVTGGTINQSGFLKCRATHVGRDTTLSKIIQMVSDASMTKAPAQRIADKVSGIFVPSVITIAVIVTAIWLFCGMDMGYSLGRGISVLVISCPCALGLATPVAIMVGNGVGARNGILFKTSESLEVTGKARIVVLDKTGTITIGKPVVTDVVAFGGIEKSELLKSAVSLEKKSEHPLAKAVVQYGEVFFTGCEGSKTTGQAENPSDQAASGISEKWLLETEGFEALPGNGVKAAIGGQEYFGGSSAFFAKLTELTDEVKSMAEKFSEEGKTPLLFGKKILQTEKTAGDIINKTGEAITVLGIIAVADKIKPEAPQVISELEKLKISVYMVTGDNEKTARAIAGQCGIKNVIAGVLPGEKEKVVRQLQAQGKVIMTGDGINDGPALTRADAGIAIGSGTDVAIDAADVVLINSNLEDLTAAIRLSRKTVKNIYENLFWAFIYNVIGIPLAAGAYISLLGWEMSPMFGAACMSLSSFCVVSNALRLNFVKIRNNKSIKNMEKKMTKTLKIEGMMCSHCEAHVKKALESVNGVKEAVASHEKGTAVVTLSKDVDNALLQKAVEEADYKVLGIE